MKSYRCNNCGTEFEAPRPACDKCEIDPAHDPRFRHVIVPLETLHFDPPSKVAGIGKGYRACKPEVKGFGGERHTGSPLAVTCAACRETDIWKQVRAEWGDGGIPEQYDERVDAGEKKG